VKNQGVVEDQIPRASKNNLPSLPVEKYDILLGVIPITLLSQVHFE